MAADALFTPEPDGRWLPTDLARGPWSPAQLHGGPVAALAARAVELLDTPGPMDPARMTLELLKAVPLEPLTVGAEVIRAGRNVQLSEVEIHSGETLITRGRVLRFRRAEGATAPWAEATAVPPPPPPPAEGGPQRFFRDEEWVAFHNTAVDHRFVAGAFEALGPATDWIRLRVPVVPGEEPSPFQRVVAAADFANGVSAVIPFDQATFINADLTVHLNRPAVGEWIGLEARTTVGPHGTALAHTSLFDSSGLVGTTAQSLLVQPR